MPIAERLEGRLSLITDLSPEALFLNQPDLGGEAVNEVKVVHYSQHHLDQGQTDPLAVAQLPFGL